MAHSYPKGCYFKSLSEIQNKKITIMGLGLNGGGEACARFFLKYGAKVIVTDMKSEAELQKSVDALKNDKSINLSNLEFHLGGHDIKDFEDADCVIKNPGVKYDGNKFLQAAKNIETDLSIFLNFSKSPIIAVTGSKGKSSTVSAIHYGLSEAGFTSFLGGNITVSPLTFLEKTNEKTPVVIEFSSWQLADLRGRGILKPYISIITKIVPDHQNWYGDMESYVSDKTLIYQNQDENDFSIFDFGKDEEGTGPKNCDTWGNLFSKESRAKILRYNDSPLPPGFYGVWQDKDENGNWCGKIFLPNMKTPEIILKSLSVPGAHMKTNALNAALVLYLMKVPAEKIINILGKWNGIEHRLQFCHKFMRDETTFNFYNDSCATVPEAVIAATKSFESKPILLTGGTDKGLSALELIKYLSQTEKPFLDIYFLEGTFTDKIVSELKKSNIEFNGPYDSLDSLLIELKNKISEKKYEKLSQNKNIQIVFSPGATSFGMFKNEFDRGYKFMDKTKNIF